MAQDIRTNTVSPSVSFSHQETSLSLLSFSIRGQTVWKPNPSFRLLWPHWLQHTSPPSPSSAPGVYSNSCPLSRWCHPTISSSVIPFSSRLQSFLASGSFQMNQFFTSVDQSIGVSASASVLLMNTQDWSPLRWIGGTSLHKGTLKSLL